MDWDDFTSEYKNDVDNYIKKEIKSCQNEE